ncbi:hypothetical protein HPP92_008321 [Vanilla planifolia]|uniref:Disease resistance RPP13-like protein 1 n=1 Tax=Vanilla planifolia TaxID=51239 RepID=A0A835RBQ6_VANPL|nr:hypothetical protein HPP92_008321 [Vanilla planifolia]
MRRAMACGVKPALDDLRLEQEVKDELAKLAKDLLVLQTYLRDAENKQQTNETVRLWLGNLQDVAYDANDVLDECALEAQRQKVIVLAQLRKSVSLINPKRSLFLHKVSRRERKIKERMEELQRQRQAYGLKIIEQESPPHRSESTSLRPPEIIGRDEDKANLEDKLTKKILESIDGSPHPNVSLDSLQKELLKKLRGKKFLLVLDDVWIEDWRQWHKFRTPLLQGCTGSKILVTTTSNDVAKALTSSIYRLRPLRDDDCWSLFYYYMVQQNPIRLEEVAIFEREIARNCNGLPSAAMDLAVRLSMEPDRSRWRSVLQADNQHSDSSRADLRYRLLPAHLKPCFSFCSVFPIGFEFEEEELVRLWMSQSFIQPYDQDLRMEDVGRTRGRRIAEHGNGFAKNRHLSLMPQEKPSLFNRQSVNDQLKGLYTLVIFDDSVTELPDDFTKKFERLRALDLSHTGIHKLPDSIHHLKHLRCLQLGGTNITRLPDALCCLYFLQTLGLQNCSMLEELPKEMKYLQCLRHIDLHWDHDSLMAPGHIPRFVVSEKKRCGVEELGNMTSLHGELLVSNLQLVRDAADAKAANLEGKEHLQCLELQWNAVDKEAAKFRRDLFGRDSVERFAARLEFAAAIRDCSCYELIKLPEDWQHTNLVYLGVKHCPKLRFLPDELGKFGALQDLEIQRCPSLSSLPEQFGFMKSLERLEISDCPSLLAMPSSLPTSLHVLSINNCRWLKERCKEGEDDWPKIKNVFSVWVDGDVILPCRRT